MSTYTAVHLPKSYKPLVKFQCKPPLNLGDEPEAGAFTRSSVPHRYALEHSSGQPYWGEVKNATVATVQFLVFDENHFYLESYHNTELMQTIVPFGAIGPLNNGMIEANFEGVPQIFYKGAAILIAGPHSANYHHWILEILPRLWILDKHPEFRILPIIIPPLEHQFQRDTLRQLLSPGVEALMHGGGVLKVDRLILPSFLAPGGNSREQLDWLRTKFLKRKGSLKRLLYISRVDAINGRRVANEKKLVRYLERRGFEKLVLSEMDHVDQVNIFTDAKVIVGVSGAGITNHVFAPEGAHVIEIHPIDYTNRAYFFTTNLLNQTYQFLICHRDQEGNVEVPITRIRSCLDRVL